MANQTMQQMLEARKAGVTGVVAAPAPPAPEVTDQAPKDPETVGGIAAQADRRFFLLGGARSYVYRSGVRGIALPDHRGEVLEPETPEQLAELLEAVAHGNITEVK